MCGVTGWIDWRKNLDNEHRIVKKMAETLSKRGPDDIQVWLNGSAAFGHTRLIVVDPAGGKQPMTKTRGASSYTIVYNGELYNTAAIRNELKSKGYRFDSHSDTEVLLTAYLEWEEKCVDILNGIFAFAIWDESEEKLFMARDRLGVKPLFFQEKDGRLLFGSELKAILAHPDVTPAVDREGLADLFAVGPSRTPGHGIFKGMEELRPAHALTYSRNGLKKWRYWNVESRPHTDSLSETVSNVKALVIDAVERQLVADVPVCTFLSGGVDSSAITAIAANTFKRAGKSPLNTYSIDYEENDKYFKENKYQPDPDGPWIDMMSKSYGTAHHRCVISNRSLAGLLKEAVTVRDQPGMADIDSSLLWFCRRIKQDVTVGLSGECADEIFGGYPWFHHPGEAEKGVFPWMRSTKARQRLLVPSWQSKLNLEEYVQRRYAETVSETPVLEGERGVDARRRELFYMNMVWFMTTLLDRKDRMSMGASLEVRVPFADHRLVEYVWNVPWELKMHGGREKGILRKALEGLLPDDVLYRKKSPYPKTHHPGYTRAVQTWMKEILADPNAPLFEFFDRKKVKEINDSGGASFKDPWFGQLMTGPQLIAHLAQINYWFEAYGVKVAE
ncbi:asparagine synthase (glutamine-hydrolyzing) [Bacillus marinisedimentorum]|uniref:asparagine synthase (glutamine-hydrolyzing) n=1 Tax=Bacillus marinisedimentorum TaxID=1821260 RepID=UPI000872FD4B|nr:asparagine synthase (glutamine-hydrolyzing) [Bacillus marinisedimentorum]